MSEEFALKLTSIRLRQVAKLLEWMIDNHNQTDALVAALTAVNDAHKAIRGALAGTAQDELSESA